jgi:hypothetical protein
MASSGLLTKVLDEFNPAEHLFKNTHAQKALQGRCMTPLGVVKPS